MTNDKLLKLCTIASVSVATTLVATKLLAYFLTDSVAILSSLTDSTMDMLLSFANFFVIRYALKPADNEHKYGHGRMEDLAAFMQAIIIFGVAITIGYEAYQRILTPVEVKVGPLAVGVMVFSLIATTSLVRFQHHVYKKTNSNIIKADSVHYLTDILSNSAIIISLIIGHFFEIPYLDPALAIMIALYILHEAYEVAESAFNHLMDRQFEDELIIKIDELIKSHPKVLGYTDLRTRRAGRKEFVQFNFTTDGSRTLNEAHDISHELEEILIKEFPNADFNIHQEPA